LLRGKAAVALQFVQDEAIVSVQHGNTVSPDYLNNYASKSA